MHTRPNAMQAHPKAEYLTRIGLHFAHDIGHHSPTSTGRKGWRSCPPSRIHSSSSTPSPMWASNTTSSSNSGLSRYAMNAAERQPPAARISCKLLPLACRSLACPRRRSCTLVSPLMPPTPSGHARGHLAPVKCRIGNTQMRQHAPKLTEELAAAIARIVIKQCCPIGPLLAPAAKDMYRAGKRLSAAPTPELLRAPPLLILAAAQRENQFIIGDLRRPLSPPHTWVPTHRVGGEGW